MSEPRLQTISTEQAPLAIGPYSQGIRCDGWIYVSGQIPIDPTSGELETGDIQAQTHRVLRNLRAVLQAGGGDLDTVVKTTVYLSDMANFAPMNEVYAEHFQGHKPARATVQAAGLPKGVDVEIDATALVR